MAINTNAQLRARELIRNNDVTIDLIAEGSGPLIVMLPSRGRDSEDYDEVAAGIAHAGFRVLRPQPRGVMRSTGPLAGITLHDLAADVAFVIFVPRMTAVDHPHLVRGIVLAAAAAKSYPTELAELVGKAGDLTLTDA